MTVPENNLVAQQIALMKVENVHLSFTADAIEEISAVASEVNSEVENIGKTESIKQTNKPKRRNKVLH